MVSLLIRKHSFQGSYFEEALMDSCLSGCGPLRGARLTALDVIACDWSRTSIHRLLPLYHHWMISDFSQTQVVGRACRMQGGVVILMLKWSLFMDDIDVSQSVNSYKTLTRLWHGPALTSEVIWVFGCRSQSSQIGCVHLELVDGSFRQTLHLPHRMMVLIRLCAASGLPH